MEKRESKTKKCQNCNESFTIDASDFEFYKKIDVPEPTFCPQCRAQRRFVFRNEKVLHKRKCDFSGKEIYSTFSSESPVVVYDRKIWLSDEWDPLEYGRDYDFGQPFFEQFGQLMKEIPWPSRIGVNMVDSDYSSNAADLKNCYSIFHASEVEDSAYGANIVETKDSYDNYGIKRAELCYEGFMLTDCYKAFFSSNCESCQEIMLCRDCWGCSDCFGCVNLRHKKYHIFNKEYSKEEYFEKIKEFDLGSFASKQGELKRTRKFWMESPVRFMHGKKNGVVSGEYIDNGENALDSYMMKDVENVRFCQFISVSPVKDSYDSTITGKASMFYENLVVGLGASKIKFSMDSYPGCHNLEYAVQCQSSHDLFGCVGLRHKSYCILNKQYTKEEYFDLVAKIKKHMSEMPFTDKTGNVYKYGEFFPSDLSPLGYNETIAQEYFPLTKERALQKGYRWHDRSKSEYASTVKAGELPDHIKDVGEPVLKEIIECANEPGGECKGSGVFRLIGAELKFYKKHNLPLPRLCPDCRHHERIKQRNPMKLHKRSCMKEGCENEFETTYAPDRKEIVYCKECYQKEIE